MPTHENMDYEGRMRPLRAPFRSNRPDVHGLTLCMVSCKIGLTKAWLIQWTAVSRSPGPTKLSPSVEDSTANLFSERPSWAYHGELDQLQRKYGDILCLFAAGKRIVVLNSYRLIQEVATKQWKKIGRYTMFGNHLLANGLVGRITLLK
ncbi:unnamed protein product [Protopolystoma xenopodis]|uniref:Uncharacterized protein n=1 Tax=Protopolystoma xenopodis TaxID=117903 RepID=A0A448XN86_9PLAT|nr:unnamed protein product [Protopolystoma xenopodis]